MSRHIHRKIPGLAILFALCCATLPDSGRGGGVLAAAGGTSAITEYEAKAGFLVLFGLYTQWPEERFATANSPLVIGVFGEDPFNGALQKIVARQQGLARPMEVRRVSTVAEASRCHVVFVSNAEEAHEAERFAALNGQAILLVGESPETIEHGGAIALKVVEKRVRFEASWPALQKAHLKAASGMLASALRVHGKEGGP